MKCIMSSERETVVCLCEGGGVGQGRRNEICTQCVLYSLANSLLVW